MERGEIGQIIEVKGNKIKIELPRKQSCANCGSPFCHIAGDKKMIIEARSPFEVKEGQYVKVSLEPKVVMKASFLTHILPLVALIIGVIIGGRVGTAYNLGKTGDLLGAILGIWFLFLAFYLLRVFNSRFERSGEYLPTVVEIFGEGKQV